MSIYYVIRPDELSALNHLSPGHPRPVRADWINRGTDQVMKKQTVDMLLRTLFSTIVLPSVAKLHRTSGLRVQFNSETDRQAFAQAFSAAKVLEQECCSNRITMMFDERVSAALAAEHLVDSGVQKNAVSILWRAGQFMDTDYQWVKGHSLLSVAGATTSGSIAGLALGVALMTVPGVGQIAAIGGLAASALGAAPVITGIFGATAAAIGKMISDADVDDVSMKQYASKRGQRLVFVSVDLSGMPDIVEATRSIMKQHGGRPATKSR